MRQAGYLAAAGIYALENHRMLLKADNDRARIIGSALAELSYVHEVHPVDTNIVIAELSEIDPQRFLDKLAAQNILALPFGGQQIRMVTHLGINDKMIDRFREVLETITF